MAKSTIPRADSAVIYDDDPEYLSEFRAAMLARGLSIATRNAYSQDVRLCIRLSDTPVNLWQPSDVRNHLMCLKDAKKSRAVYRTRVGKSVPVFCGKLSQAIERITLVNPSKHPSLAKLCPKRSLSKKLAHY